MSYKSILVTGATGSFGQHFIEYLLKKKKLKKLVIYSRDELKQYEMSQRLKHKCLRFFLGDIRDVDRLETATRNIDLVVHAAALKQVAAAEYNPTEFIKTNVIGSQNIIEACIKSKVKKIIALSTDKAAAPINLYGATKLCSDKLFISANEYSGNNLRCSIVRYGNVFGSRGSVAETFSNINDVFYPVTSGEMTRFSLTLKQSVEVVDWAMNNSIGGEIIIPKIPSYRILDLVKAFNPKGRAKITGLRRGEKISEDLITIADGLSTYDIGKYYLILKDGNKNTLKDFKKKFPKIKKVKKDFYYNSSKNKFLSIKELKKKIMLLENK